MTLVEQLQSSLKQETPVDLELTENPLYFEPYLQEYATTIHFPNLENDNEILTNNEQFPFDKSNELLNRLSPRNKILHELEPDFKLPMSLLIQKQLDFNPISEYCPSHPIHFNPPSHFIEPIRDIEHSTCKGTKLTNIHATDNKSSIQLNRKIGSDSEYISGSSTSLPFLPGGMESDVDTRMNTVIPQPSELLTIAPGLPHGLQVDVQQQSILHDTLDTLLSNAVNKLEIGDIQQATSNPTEQINLESEDPLDALLAIDAAPPTPPQYAHEVPNEDIDLSMYKMAKEWPFELDIFQKQSIYHLEQGHSIFVAAHTSAGKTVVAEYAIAMSILHSTKCIYTSPIKALSNQKYRDFKQNFESVGIITGDVQIDPDSNCIIMTTEILRSMLYHGADVLRDLEFVIFDEIHYLNDIERGVCWEEVIVLLPSHVKIIMLSATVPNTMEFCEWVGRTKIKDIYIITTYKRPVPLEYNLYLGNSTEFYKIIEANGTEVNKQIWKKAYDQLFGNKPSTNSSRGRAVGRGGRGGGRGGAGGNKQPMKRSENTEKQMLISLIYQLQKRQLLPCILFCFSRRKCELYAQLITIDLSTNQQKSYISKFFNKALLSLNKEDRELPQIQSIQLLLMRGIGCHHSGMLPLLKEIVEILFCQGYLHVLFATETFAMGVNAPAKSVVFTNNRKFDGVNFRDLLPGEFVQMSGRSGRRNKDIKGVVILCCIDFMPNVNWLYSMILTNTDKLQSQFRITYNMMINLLRVNYLNVFDMMKRSFLENDKKLELPRLKETLEQQLELLTTLPIVQSGVYNNDIYEYYTTIREYYNYRLQLYHLLYHAKQGLCPIGRVILTSTGALGIICNHENGKIVVFALDMTSNKHDILIGKLVMPKIVNKLKLQIIMPKEISVVYDVVDKSINRFHGSKIPNNIAISILKRLKIIGLDISKNKSKVFMIVLKDVDYMHTYQQYTDKQTQLHSYKCINGPDFINDFELVANEVDCKLEIQKMEYLINNQDVSHLEEYNARLIILKELKFINDDNLVLLKGRIMAEINTMDSLLITELLFDNYFVGMECNEILSICSVLIFQEKVNEEDVRLPNRLKGYYERFKAKALELARLQETYKLPGIEAETYLKDVLRPGLMEVVYEWANGMPFNKITDLTQVLEGSIVRCITRLNEGCRELKGAAKLMGNLELVEKMEHCQTMIRRDIVFAASLYL